MPYRIYAEGNVNEAHRAQLILDSLTVSLRKLADDSEARFAPQKDHVLVDSFVMRPEDIPQNVKDFIVMHYMYTYVRDRAVDISRDNVEEKFLKQKRIYSEMCEGYTHRFAGNRGMDKVMKIEN